MATLGITDKLGLSLEPQVKRSFSFREYFAQLTRFGLPNIRFDEILNPPLKQLPLESLDFGVKLDDPIAIEEDRLSLAIEAGLSGGFLITTSKDGELENGGRFGAPIEVPAGSAYVGLFVQGQGGGTIERKAGDANFGFGLGAEFRLASHSKVSDSDPFGDSLRAAVENFAVVADWEDIEALPDDVVVVAEGEGSLRVALGAEIAATPNPLLSVDLPLGDAKLEVTPGGKFSVKTAFTVSGGYQVRVRRLGGSLVELGYYKAKGKAFEFTLDGSFGVSAGAGQFDLLGQVLGAISSNAKADRDTLTKGGLNATQIERIEDILKEGVQRKVHASLDATFGSARDSGTALLFEIDTKRTDEAARAAIVKALHGDLTALTGSTVLTGSAATGSVARGVKLLHSVFHKVEKRTHVLRINLLGIYNHISVGKLLLRSRIVVDPNGDITIVDQVTAERAGVSMTQFGADEEKLRKLLMESFLMSAAYHASDQGLSAPDLRVEQVYFELHGKTNYQNMKDNLDVGGALDLLDPLEKRRLIGTPPREFGRSTLFAATGYDAALAQRLFLDGSRQRTAAYYENAGREAVLRLFEPGDDNDFIRLFAGNNTVWKEMKQRGFTQFGRVYRENGFALNQVQVQFMTSYAIAVIEWAKSMAALSKDLADWRQAKRPKKGAGKAKAIEQQREQFLKRLRDVASKTKAKWSEPWGLTAMYLALKPADRKAVGVQSRVHGTDLQWAAQRNPAILPDGTPLLES